MSVVVVQRLSLRHNEQNEKFSMSIAKTSGYGFNALLKQLLKYENFKKYLIGDIICYTLCSL